MHLIVKFHEFKLLFCKFGGGGGGGGAEPEPLGGGTHPAGLYADKPLP